MNKTHLRTYANHIRSARLNRAEALQLELAVMFAVIVECNGNRRLAREAIYDVYNTSGSYQCAQPADRDWKAIGREITAGQALYDYLTQDNAEEVASWGTGLKHGELIAAYAEQIRPLKLATYNEILTLTGKVKPATQRGPRHAPEGSFEIRTEHCHVIIPPNVSADELMTVINKLMEYGNMLLDRGKTRTHRKAA